MRFVGITLDMKSSQDLNNSLAQIFVGKSEQAGDMSEAIIQAGSHLLSDVS